MTADLDLSPEAVGRLARPIPVSNNLQVTPAITHGYALELRPVRWLPYKPDGRRQMKQRGRWQEMNEYGGWGNCKTPNEIWPGLTAPDLISGYHAALAENARLRAENERLRADMSGGSFYQEDDIDAMQNEIERLTAENARCRAAVMPFDNALCDLSAMLIEAGFWPEMAEEVLTDKEGTTADYQASARNVVEGARIAIAAARAALAEGGHDAR